MITEKDSSSLWGASCDWRNSWASCIEHDQ